MALATSQSLSKDTPTDVDTNLTVFVQRFADNGKSVFSVAGLTLPEEKLLTVSHDVDSKGNQRKLIRIDRTAIDALLVPATCSVYMNIVRPPSTAITNALIIEMVNQLIDFLIEGGSNANVTAVLNGES
jgi:hypothetical protein